MQNEHRLPLMIRAGRGNSGGTTLLNAVVELALREGRAPVLLDAARNAGLSDMYEGCIRPASHAIKDIKAAFSTLLDAMMTHAQGGVFDLGGGQDDTLVAIYKEIDIVEFGLDAGVRPVFAVTFGPDMGDFEHALEIKKRNIFDGADVLLVQSEGVLREGQDAEDSFGQILARKEYGDWIAEGAAPLYLKYLRTLVEIRKRKLFIRDAALDIPDANGNKLGFSRAWQTKTWLDGLNRQFVNNKCDDWRV